ncbi:MAG: hypothetical protein U1F98_02495 [Verrucomicrobiota bacterium]
MHAIFRDGVRSGRLGYFTGAAVLVLVAFGLAHRAGRDPLPVSARPAVIAGPPAMSSPVPHAASWRAASTEPDRKLFTSESSITRLLWEGMDPDNDAREPAAAFGPAALPRQDSGPSAALLNSSVFRESTILDAKPPQVRREFAAGKRFVE